MFLKPKRTKEQAEYQRQLIIAYKKVFLSEEGKLVFSDLANRFHLLNAFPGVTKDDRDIHEGSRRVILHILKQREIDLAQFDKLLRGEFDAG